jgi:hypothetical protein
LIREGWTAMPRSRSFAKGESRERPRAPRRAALLIALLGALSLGTACRRKAPGPEECRRFALHAAGVRSARDLSRSSRLRASIDDLTRECLVTPYDRELLRCVEESGRLRACQSRFELRRRAD